MIMVIYTFASPAALPAPTIFPSQHVHSGAGAQR